MTRHAGAAVVVLCLCPVWSFAQSEQIVVNGASANVHKAPTTASPVIATAPRGAALDVTRNIGSWLKVAWPDAPDGVGYVHVSLVTTARPPLSGRSAGLASRSPRSAQDSRIMSTGTYRQAIEDVARHGSLTNAGNAASAANGDNGAGNGNAYTESAGMYITPTAHVVGLGGRMAGSTLGWGASVRAWPHRHLGVQVDVSRYSLASPGMPALTSVQFAPSVLYRLPDRVTDYFWVRPYFGGGATMHRQSLVAGVTDTALGYQAFGGAEFTFASVPRFAVSADAGYRRWPNAFASFDLGGVAFSVAGHWYFK